MIRNKCLEYLYKWGAENYEVEDSKHEFQTTNKELNNAISNLKRRM